MTQQTTSPNSIANGMKFATHDADSGIHCARNYHGSWWYNMCFGANLNGRYSSGPNIATGEGLVWYHWHGFDYSLKATTLMIRKI